MADYKKHVDEWKKSGKALPNPVPKEHWDDISKHQKKENTAKGLTHFGGKKISYSHERKASLAKKIK